MVLIGVTVKEYVLDWIPVIVVATILFWLSLAVYVNAYGAVPTKVAVKTVWSPKQIVLVPTKFDFGEGLILTIILVESVQELFWPE